MNTNVPRGEDIQALVITQQKCLPLILGQERLVLRPCGLNSVLVGGSRRPAVRDPPDKHAKRDCRGSHANLEQDGAVMQRGLNRDRRIRGDERINESLTKFSAR